jgi:hypothetical protein
MVFKLIWPVFIFCAAIFLLFPESIKAANFIQVSVRLDLTKVSTSTGGMVCAQPTTNGSESSVSITFPSGFSLNSAAANWTVNTDNLPAGTLAWPGIDTATSIAGQTVTFPSGNMATTNRYCFSFSETNTLTNKSTAGTDLAGTVITKNSSNNVIDSSDFSLATTVDDQISINGAVPAKVGDLTVVVYPQSVERDPYAQDTYMNYRLVYSSNLFSSTNFTLQAEWSRGAVEDSSFIDIVDYVPGSATKAYNDTPAIIDLTNKTISWSVTNFPSKKTDQEVSFKLKTRNDYTGPLKVRFFVTGRIFNDQIHSLDYVVPQTFLHQDIHGVAPSSSPRPPSPSSVPQPLAIQNISLENVSQQNATISVLVNSSSTVTVQYGKNPSKLDKTLKSISRSNEHTINLEGLDPDTDYYFRLVISDELGHRLTSDLYTFKTAQSSEQPKVNPNSVVVTSQNNILLSPGSSSSDGLLDSNLVIIPKNTEYEFTFALNKDTLLKNVQAFIRKKGLTALNQNVLGINSAKAAESSISNINLFDLAAEAFVGKLKSPNETGFYEVLAKLEDYQGNVVEQKIFNLKTVESLTVVDSKNDKGIEKARVLISRYNPKMKMYEVLSPAVYPVRNPQYTDPTGFVNFVLPEGKYKAEVSRVGYKNKTVEFNLGSGKNQNYPKITVEAEGFNLINMFKYYTATFSDLLDTTKLYLGDLIKSVRFFDLMSATVVSLLLILTTISFSARTHIHVWDIPKYLITHLRFLFRKQSEDFIRGVVTDHQSKTPISQALVNLIDLSSGKVLTNFKTGKNGHFIVKKPKNKFELLIIKNGYEISSESKHLDQGSSFINIQLKKGDNVRLNLVHTLIVLVQKSFGLSFEVLLFISFILELLFLYYFGFWHTLPFMVMSVLTLVIWSFYLKSSQSIPTS